MKANAKRADKKRQYVQMLGRGRRTPAAAAAAARAVRPDRR